MEYPHVLKLLEPVKFGEETIIELVFQKPKAKHFRSMKLGGATVEAGELLTIAGKLSGQLPAMIDELCPADMMAVISVAGKSLEDGPATGKPA